MQQTIATDAMSKTDNSLMSQPKLKTLVTFPRAGSPTAIFPYASFAEKLTLKSAIHDCIKADNVEGVLHELSKNPECINLQDMEGYTPLSLAVKFGKEKIVDILIKMPKLNANLQDNFGKTALMIASESRGNFVSKLLNIKGIDINLQDEKGNTALILAVKAHLCDNVVKLLKTKDIDINLFNDFGETALLFSIMQADYKIFDELIKNKNLDANIRTCYGESPLLFAVRFCDVYVVSKLLEKPNVDFDTPDSFGRTAISIAKEYNYTKIYDMLCGYIK